jgi:hypothetical protein
MKTNSFIIILICLAIISIATYQIYIRKGNYWDPTTVKENFYNTPVIMYTSYNRSYQDRKFVKLNKEILNEYADLHGYEYKCIVHDDDFMSPYWTRVYDLLNICRQSPENSLIMYFDADAIPRSTVKNISIESFVESIDNGKRSVGDSTSDFYVSEDPAVKFDLFYGGVFNSGVFIVRNTPDMRALVKKWMDMYNNGHKWYRKNDKWECKIYDRTCLWSFSGYEQYALTELYKEHPEKFTRLHWTTLACTKEHKNCFVVHLMGSVDTEREVFFKKSLESYKSNK